MSQTMAPSELPPVDAWVVVPCCHVIFLSYDSSERTEYSFESYDCHMTQTNGALSTVLWTLGTVVPCCLSYSCHMTAVRTDAPVMPGIMTGMKTIPTHIFTHLQYFCFAM